MTALASLVRRLALLVVVVFALGLPAQAQFFPLEAVAPGLRGTGKTVVRGTEIETFEVEFLGVVRDAGPAGDLILVRVSGDTIERTGGIAAGMSGSPVYVGDQLVGAISYGYALADHRIGFVTPIGDMLDVLELVRRAKTSGEDSEQPGGEGGAPAAAPIAVQVPVVDGVPVHGVVLAASAAEAQALAAAVPPGTLVFTPVRAPLLAAGLSSRAAAMLSQRLQRFDVVPLQAGGGTLEGVATPALEPGSAFAVQLMRGDVSLASIGTVTYVDDGHFVGFGHSLLARGAVGYLVTGAFIHYVVQSVETPFKIGSVLAPAGALLQDRAAAVAGRLGETPRMIPVSVSVHDLDRDAERTFAFEVAADEELLVDLVAVGALSALDRGLDRLGRGTAEVVFQIDARGLPRPLVRDNLYYSDRDIAAVALLELMEAVQLVVSNRFSRVDVERIQFTAHVEQQRRTAHIERATPSKTEVRPGETVEIEVQLRPFRGEVVREVVSLTVPADALPGPVTVEVRGGGWGWRLPSTEEEELIIEDPEVTLGIVTDLERLIEEFVRRERNNEIVAEFYGRRADEPEPREPAANGERGEPDEEEPASGWQQRFEGGGWVVSTRPTPYVILGSQYFDLTIVAPDEPETAAVRFIQVR